jgi:RNase P/RNase MRP subunit p30
MEKTQILLTQKDFNKLKNEVKKTKEEEKQIIYFSEDDELNRKVIEKLDINVLLLNLNSRKDFQKQRNSGFNQVMAKIMKKKDLVLGINIDELIGEANLKRKSEIIARIKQNISICNKNKVKMKIITQNEKNRRNIHDLRALGIVLGMPTWMTKQI